MSSLFWLAVVISGCTALPFLGRRLVVDDIITFVFGTGFDFIALCQPVPLLRAADLTAFVDFCSGMMLLFLVVC